MSDDQTRMRDDETEIEYMKRIALSCTEEEIWRAVFVSEVKLLFLKLMLELNFVDPAGADVFDLLPRYRGRLALNRVPYVVDQAAPGAGQVLQDARFGLSRRRIRGRCDVVPQAVARQRQSIHKIDKWLIV